MSRQMNNRRPPRPDSSGAIWPPLVRFIALEARLGQWAQQWQTTSFLYEFCRFGVKQAWACLFGGTMVALLIATHLWYPRGAPLSRYDFLFLAALAIQAAILRFRLETWEEAKVIL